MPMGDKKAYREVLGQRLKEFREEQGLTASKVALKGGIRVDQVEAVESGETDYTIDVFVGYIVGCDLYMFFSEKSKDRQNPHDFEDLLRMGRENDPKL